MAGHRAAIQYKARHMARLEQRMKPPLPESAAAVWVDEHGTDATMAAIAYALSLWLAAKRRAG
jgi:L-asparaginase/Glu-tRNA(Gln) amidotransferase subunit D